MPGPILIVFVCLHHQLIHPSQYVLSSSLMIGGRLRIVKDVRHYAAERQSTIVHSFCIRRTDQIKCVCFPTVPVSLCCVKRTCPCLSLTMQTSHDMTHKHQEKHGKHLYFCICVFTFVAMCLWVCTIVMHILVVHFSSSHPPIVCTEIPIDGKKHWSLIPFA